MTTAAYKTQWCHSQRKQHKFLSVSSCHFGFTSETADHEPIKRSKGNAIGHVLGSPDLRQGFPERAGSKSQ